MIEKINKPHGHEVNLHGVPNGAFLRSVEPKAARSSVLSEAVKSIALKYMKEGGLSFALQFIKDHPALPLKDYWDNAALLGFRVNSAGESRALFDDATSSGGPRTLDMYTNEAPLGKSNPLNEDHRLWVFSALPKGKRPKSFVIPADAEPVMAIVALDPSRLGTITEPERDKLIKEIRRLRVSAASVEEVIRDAAGDEMSDRLRYILSDCLLANDTYISSNSSEGAQEKWRIPFDLFASLKALYTLISGDFHSGNMRQGAVRVGIKDSASGYEGIRDIIVAGSGLNSAIDEMVARNFATEVLANYAEHQIPKANRHAFSY